MAHFYLRIAYYLYQAIQDAQEQSETVGDGSETPDLENITMVNSRVLSVSIGNLTLVDLRDPVVITFTHRLQVRHGKTRRCLRDKKMYKKVTQAT